MADDGHYLIAVSSRYSLVSYQGSTRYPGDEPTSILWIAWEPFGKNSHGDQADDKAFEILADSIALWGSTRCPAILT